MRMVPVECVAGSSCVWLSNLSKSQLPLPALRHVWAAFQIAPPLSHSNADLLQVGSADLVAGAAIWRRRRRLRRPRRTSSVSASNSCKSCSARKKICKPRNKPCSSNLPNSTRGSRRWKRAWGLLHRRMNSLRGTPTPQPLLRRSHLRTAWSTPKLQTQVPTNPGLRAAWVRSQGSQIGSLSLRIRQRLRSRSRT